MWNGGLEELIYKIIKICDKHDIDVSDIDALYARRNKT